MHGQFCIEALSKAHVNWLRSQDPQTDRFYSLILFNNAISWRLHNAKTIYAGYNT
jgi:hypothetical protein